MAQSLELEQITTVLKQIVAELKGLSGKVETLSLEVKQIKQEMNENSIKYTSEMKSIKVDIEEIHAHEFKLAHQIGQITSKAEQRDKRISLLEEEMRKYNLVIRGIQEKNPDDLKQRVLKWLNNLDIMELSVTDLASVFRIGYKRRGMNRNVLVRIADLSTKLQIMAKLRELGVPPEFEGKPIQVFSDISREERSWRYSLKPITKFLRDKGIKYNWRPLQQLKFFYKNRMQTINPQIDAVEYLRELGLIEKEEDITEIINQMRKMGASYIKTPPQEKEVAPEDPKRKKRKEISPVIVEHKKSRDEKGEVKADDSEEVQGAECGELPFSSSPLSALLGDIFK